MPFILFFYYYLVHIFSNVASRKIRKGKKDQEKKTFIWTNLVEDSTVIDGQRVVRVLKIWKQIKEKEKEGRE